MDLNLLTMFLSVYKHKSITLAANELDISQPAVSAALKRLETTVGKALFVREGRGISPTGAAVALANKVESPLEVLSSVEQQAQQLNIYCSEIALPSIVNIDDLLISASPLKEQEVIDDIITQKVDLVIDVMRSKSNSIVVDEIAQEDAVCLVRQDHPRIQGSLSNEQFYNEQHIALKIRRDNQSTLDLLALSPAKARRVKIETESVTTMLALAEHTDYIASATRSFAMHFAHKFSLSIYEYPIELKPVSLSLVYHRRFANDPFHKLKREEIKAAISSQQL